MIVTLYRIICEQCRTYRNVQAKGEIAVREIMRRKGWCDYNLGYGNYSDFCTPECREAWIRENGMDDE